MEYYTCLYIFFIILVQVYNMKQSYQSCCMHLKVVDSAHSALSYYTSTRWQVASRVIPRLEWNQVTLGCSICGRAIWQTFYEQMKL